MPQEKISTEELLALLPVILTNQIQLLSEQKYDHFRAKSWTASTHYPGTD